MTLAWPATSTRSVALTQVRQALSMIIDDPYARSLLPTVSAGDGASGDRSALADWLYARWWCGPGLRATQADPTDPAARTEAERGAARLEAGRLTTAPRSAGWLVLAAVGDVLVAARLGVGPGEPPTAGRRITTTPAAVVSSSRPGLPPRPGDLVTVRHGAAGLDSAHGWWWAHSTGPEELSGLPLDRWYVHARDLAAAATLVPLLLAIVAETDCPATLKCPPVEDGYGRRDALVVYLPRDRSGAAERTLLRHAADIAPLVRDEVPPLTRQLMPGVARAEDPGRGPEESGPEAFGHGELGTAVSGPDGPGREQPVTETQPVSYGQLRCGQVARVAVGLAGRHPRRALPQLSDGTLVAALSAVGMDVDAIERVG